MTQEVACLGRTDGRDSLSLVPAVREVVRGIDARVPVISPRTLESVTARSMARTSFTLALLGMAGVRGLVLSTVGLCGVVSYVVLQRRVSSRRRRCGDQAHAGAPLLSPEGWGYGIAHNSRAAEPPIRVGD